MIIDLSSLTTSDYAAWWGAIIASFALIWNVVTFIRSGARIKVYVSTNMELFPPNPGKEDNTYTFLRAVNVGDSATTIMHFCGYSAETIFDRFRKKAKHFIISNANTNQPLPFKLEPGEEWTGLALQDELLKDKKFVYLGVIHNQREKAIYKRVKIVS